MSLDRGTRLGPYEILEPLGTGGMGIVWKARDLRLNRLVAIKVLPADKITDGGRKQRFAQEAKAASALNHPNIVTIYDICMADGVDFIVMEYVAGATLDRRISRHGMRPAELLDLAIQIADARVPPQKMANFHEDGQARKTFIGNRPTRTGCWLDRRRLRIARQQGGWGTG